MRRPRPRAAGARRLPPCGRFVPPPPTAFGISPALLPPPTRVSPRQRLLEAAFGFDHDVLERTVDVHVMNLRRKIEHDPARPDYIQTVYGVGYKLAEDDHAA